MKKGKHVKNAQPLKNSQHMKIIQSNIHKTLIKTFNPKNHSRFSSHNYWRYFLQQYFPWRYFPVSNYLFKVNNRNIRKRCKYDQS